MTVHADRLERGAAAVAVTALAIWIGGLVALGACAAPIVFRVVPAPLSGDAMGAVFRRFDAIAVACSVFVLGCEAIRIWVRDPPATAFERARTALSLLAAAAAIYGAVRLSPGIIALHQAGAVRGSGADGTELERLHKLAEAAAQVEVMAGLFLLVLQVTTLQRAKEKPT